MAGLVVVLGSCSVDYTVYAPRLPKPGETIHGSKFAVSYGGKGANQCMAARKLGANTAMIAKVGDDKDGKDYIEYFTKSNINTNFMKALPNVTTGMAQITVSECGENQIVIVAGANAKLLPFDVESSRSLIESAKILVCQLETPIDATIKAFKICKGIRMLNAAPGTSSLSEELLSLTDILCVNESEASLITGLEVESNENLINGLKKLHILCKTVIITLGSRGAAFISTDIPVPMIVPCRKVQPIDSTGAGDAFCGALAAILAGASDVSLDRAIAASCAVASASVTKLGTQTSYPEVEAMSFLPEESGATRM